MDGPVSPKRNKFLRPYDDTVADLALDLRALILEEVPLADELLYDSYNAVSAAYSLSEHLRHAFCPVATDTRHVNLGFNQGADMDAPDGLLDGSGKRIRHLKMKSPEDLEQPHVRAFIREAAANIARDAPSDAKEIDSRSLVKSISENKRRP